jgi:DNA-directed RNA polymerase N-terminal
VGNFLRKCLATKKLSRRCSLSATWSTRKAFSTVPDLNNEFSLPTAADALGLTMKTNSSEVDSLLEKMKYDDDYNLIQELVTAVKDLSTRVINRRKAELIEEDPESYDRLESAHQSALVLRQYHMEEEQQTDAVNQYNESLKQLITMGRGTGMKYVQRVLLKWYEPLTRVLDAEIGLIEQRVTGHDRSVSAHHDSQMNEAAELHAVLYSVYNTACVCISSRNVDNGEANVVIIMFMHSNMDHVCCYSPLRN